MLVVDDEDHIRESLQDILSILDFIDVFVAENGLVGIKQLTKHKEKISCMILDLAMPVMNGVEVVKWVRHNHHFPLSVIISSGYTEREVKSKIDFYDTEMIRISFLHKPYSIDLLIKTIFDTI